MHSSRSITCKCCLSQSVLYDCMKFQILSVMCLKENVYGWRNNFHSAFKKDTEMVVIRSAIRSERLETNYCKV